MIAAWAVRYIERFDFALVPLQGKMPLRASWNHDANLIRTPHVAHAHWARYPNHNIGFCLEPSGCVSLDADHFDGARVVLAAEGIDLDELIATTPTILGRAPRLVFKAPEGITLGRKAIAWPPPAAGEKAVTVLELRAGRVQDVLPPSIHPGTGRPYRWLTPPTNGFPPLLEKLLRLWLDFDRFKQRARNLCPWADPEPTPAVSIPRRTTPYTGPSVIQAFNSAHDVVSILESNGYEAAGKRRWKSPHGHNMAGMVLLGDNKVFCHHASDGLADDKPHDAFDLYSHFDHGGDFRKAIKAAAELMGMRREVTA